MANKLATTFEIHHRWSGAVSFACELNAEIAGQSYGLRFRFAIMKALAFGADLCRADLRAALLSGADLRSAGLRGADLSGANLKDVKQDFLAEVLRLPNELEALRDALAAGKVDGSSYNGACACLAGTLAHARGVTRISHGDVMEALPGTDTAFTAQANSPREAFFTAIRSGDTPETNSASAIALKWTEEAIRIRDMIRATAPIKVAA